MALVTAVLFREDPWDGGSSNEFIVRTGEILIKFDEKWFWFCVYLIWEISWLGEPWEGRKNCEEILAPCIGRRKSFGKKDKLVVCEELARCLQRTYYDRLTLYGMWH